MVTVPEKYIQFNRKFPGYFWDKEQKQVCSLKGGVLQPLKSYVYRGQFKSFNMHVGDTYARISVNGKRYTVVFQKIQQYIDLNETILYHR